MITDELYADDLYEEIGGAIAVGSTADVFKVMRISDNTIFAKKKIRLSDENTAEMAKDEVEILKNISHPNIVNMIDSYISEESYLNIILEFCDAGSL